MNAQINDNISSELQNIRNLIVTITRNPKISIEYRANFPTSVYMPKKDAIILTLSIYPDFVKQNQVLGLKVLDADGAHESGHYIMTKPFMLYYDGFIRKAKLLGNKEMQLARDVVNLIEDKRVNYYIIMRYKYDVGKRLLFANMILRDASEEFWRTKGKEILAKGNIQIVALMNGILSAKGLYESDAKELYDYFETVPNGKEIISDVDKCLSIMENARFQRLRIDLIKSANEMFQTLKKYLGKKTPERKQESKDKSEKGKDKQKQDGDGKSQQQNKGTGDAQQASAQQKNGNEDTNEFIHVRANGKLKTVKLSKSLEEKLKEMLKAQEEKEQEQKEKEQLESDLKKNGCVGESIGTEINAPIGNLSNYIKLVERNQTYITELLNKLKKTLKPQIKREMFVKRGKFINGILGKAYAQSLRNPVKNVYVSNNVFIEKEKVNIAFLFDMSGSVPYNLALNVCTTLSETFGKWLEDYAYSLSVFGKDCFRIKTFFETYENTKARIGNLDVDQSSTCINELLKSYIKQFQTVKERERRKVLVICSDLWFVQAQEQETIDLLRLFEKLRIEIKFVTFGEVKEEFRKQFPRASHVHVENIEDLPEAFLNVYLETQARV